MKRDVTDDISGNREDPHSEYDGNGHMNGDDGHEKRKHKRLSVQNINIQGEIPLATTVSIINISSSGVLVKADRRLNLGNTYLLKIGYKDELLLARVIVKWSFLVESIEDTDGNIVPLYMAGMHFKEITSERGEEIIHTIMADVETDTCGVVEHADMSSGTAREEPNKDVVICRLNEITDLPNDPRHEEAPQELSEEALPMIIEMIEHVYERYTGDNLSYYEFLNVTDTDDAEEIKKAYYHKVKEFHPDRHASLPAEAKEKLNVLIAYLNEAYETLTNDQQRQKYDTARLRKQPEAVSNQKLAHQYFEQGKIEFWNGNYSEAEILFQHVLYLSNSSARYFYYYAKTLLKLGKFRDAEGAIRKALKLDSDNSDYLTEAGYIYHALGLSNRAEENFEMALGVEPSHVNALKGIKGIQAARENGNFDETIFHPVKRLKKMIAGL